MTDVQPQDIHTGSNGAAPTPRTKRKIANSTIDGPAVDVQFSEAFKSLKLSIDTTKVPTATLALLAAQGAASVIQTAYGSADDPVAAAQDAIKRLLTGEWRPGPARGEALPDPLLQAIADHLSKERGTP